MRAGIYKITISDTFYYGQAQDLDRREGEHLRGLRKAAHSNPHLQNAYNKYGDFSYEVVLVCETNELDRYEQWFLDQYQPLEKCANIAKDAAAPARGLTWSLTEETKAKMSAAAKGKVKSAEHRAKLRAANLGKKNGPHSAETRAKIGAAHKGRPKSPESIAKMRATKQKHTYLVTRTDGTQREYRSYGAIVEAYGISKSQVARLARNINKASKNHGIVSIQKL